jgi:membrane associated rhomboid family serine protease
MTPTPVGMRCPECARQRTRVSTAQSFRGVRDTVTRALIAINVAVFLAELASGGNGFGSGFSGVTGGSVGAHLLLFGPAISDQHEYWRILTSGFIHYGVLHIAFNMYALYIFGPALETRFGHARFALLYLAALLIGSFGALLVSPDAATAGASGAIFGLVGALIAVTQAERIPIQNSPIFGYAIVALLFTFTFSGISVGGHLGGLAGGYVAGWLLELSLRRGLSFAATLAPLVLLAVAGFAAAIAVA